MNCKTDVRWLSLFRAADKQWTITELFSFSHTFCDLHKWSFWEHKERDFWSSHTFLCEWHWNCGQQELDKADLWQTSESSKNSWRMRLSSCYLIWHSQNESSVLHSEARSQKKRADLKSLHLNWRSQSQLQSRDNQMIRSLTWHRTDFQSTFSEASSKSQEDRDKNQSFKSKKRSDF